MTILVTRVRATLNSGASSYWASRKSDSSTLFSPRGRAESRSEGSHRRPEAREGRARSPHAPEHAPRSSEKTQEVRPKLPQLGHHPLDETGQEASMLLKHLATSVKVFLTVRHLVSQSLNQCFIPPRSYPHVQPPYRHHPAAPDVAVHSDRS